MSRGFAPRSNKPFPPKRGEIWQARLDLPRTAKPSGKPPLEPPGSHPAVVLSDVHFNQSGLAIVMFMASEDHDPKRTIELPTDRHAGVDGFLSTYHIHALDWEARFVAKVGHCPPEEFTEMLRRFLLYVVDDQPTVKAILAWGA